MVYEWMFVALLLVLLLGACVLWGCDLIATAIRRGLSEVAIEINDLNPNIVRHTVFLDASGKVGDNPGTGESVPDGTVQA